MIRRTLYIILGLLPLFVVYFLLVWLFNSNSGLIISLSILEKTIPGHLQIEHASGTINSEIELQNISYQDDTLLFKAKNLHLSWQLINIIKHNTLTINDLTINDAIIQLKNTASKKSTLDFSSIKNLDENISRRPFIHLNLPFNIDVQHAQFNQVQFNYLHHSYPFTIYAKLFLSPIDTIINNFVIQSGNSKITASGKLDNQWHMQWQIAIKNLQDFVPTALGQINSTGLITGDARLPLIQTTIDAQKLHYQNKYIDSLHGNFLIDTTLHHPWQIQLAAKNIKLDKLLFDQFTLSSNDSKNQQQLNINLVQKDAQLIAHIQGQLQNFTWNGQLQQFSLISKQWGNWQLQQASAIHFSTKSAQLENSIWQSDRGRISLNANWKKHQSWTAQLQANDISLQNFSAYLPDNLQWQGQLNFVISANKLFNKQLQVQTQLNLSPGQLNYNNQQSTQKINYLGAQLQAQLNATGITSNWSIRLQNNQQINGDLNLPGYQIGKSLPQQVLNGRLKITPIPLNLLQQWLPNLTNLNGFINIDSTLQGTVSKPVITGQLQLNNGQARIPDLNINLTQIQLRAAGKPTGILQINGSITSGDGQLTVNGTTNLQQTGFPTNIQISGNHFLTINTLEYRIFTSPQLLLQVQNGKINLSGKIYVPEATITQADFKSQSVVIPSDVVFVNQKQTTASSTPANFYSQLQLILGDKINVKIMGLEGQLTGNLNLIEDPQKITTATGLLAVKNGTYKAYGQNLTITNGRLIYTGGTLTNPGIALQASKQLMTVSTANLMGGSQASNSSGTYFGNVSALPSTGGLTSATPLANTLFTQPINLTVGINVQGTLNDPQITLFSEPATLSQSDILSYLLFGQPASQISNANAQLLFQAASTLNLGGGQIDQITQQLQQKFGLSQLSLGSTSYFSRQTQSIVQYTSLTLGKKLSPRLFVNYSVGLTEPINILQITYLLTSHWSLQSSTSSIANGIDLIYSIERN